MYKSHEIKIVHLEVTSKCNAACPMCMRNMMGGPVSPHLPITEITLEDFKKIFAEDFLKQLHKLYMCGNYGEPVVARDALEIFEYVRAQNPSIHLSMNTNGSARSSEWWARMAKVLTICRFSIDGMQDTNHLYRKHTEWSKIMNNAKAYIDAGGYAEWDFIVFRHNEHQIAEARQLAQTMGFGKFQIKKTGRFFSSVHTAVKEFQEVHDRFGKLSYKIEPPEDKKYRNNALELESHLLDKYESLDKYFDQTQIECKVAQEKSIFVSADGYVFPCCWTAGQLYTWHRPAKTGQLWEFIASNGGEDKINARLHDIRTIIDGDWIQNKFTESWQQPSTKCGKLKVCAKTCGKEFDTFREQFK